MNINCFIGPLPPPLGGVAIINENFQKLDYPGFDVISFNTSNNGFKEELYKGFPWKSLGREMKKAYDLFIFLKEKKPQIANVFATSSFSILRDILFILILRCLKIRVIVHFHSKKYGEFALKPRRLKLLGRFFNKNVDKIVLLSQDHLKYFSNYFNSSQCVVIENFVNYKDFSCNIEDKTDDFLYIGRLTKEKGFFDLLEAVSILKIKNVQVKINVIGVSANNTDQSRIEEFIKEKGISSYFVFHGAKSGEEKFLIFKKSKALIFPSHFENSPVVLKEAIASRMGIIASDIEANQLILNNRENSILHKSKDLKRLADAIINFLELPDKGISLFQASTKITEFDSLVAQNKINKLINDVICSYRN